MRNLLLSLLLSQMFAIAALAHEFWIEPVEMLIPDGEALEPLLMIGEHPEGQPYAFQPQAYARAIWSGPETQVELSQLPLSAPAPSLRTTAPGLHSLAVETYPQNLTYASEDEFRRFLTDIGQDDALASVDSAQSSPPNIRETYRRYAKTLVHFSDRTGIDRRVGLPREWVAQDGKFKLFDGDQPRREQKTAVHCSAGPEPKAVTRVDLVTDQNGAIRPALPQRARCLINAVILEYDARSDRWLSDWVSLYLMTP